ncbi:MAG: oxidoreductase [Planctomycetota bacterium]
MIHRAFSLAASLPFAFVTACTAPLALPDGSAPVRFEACTTPGRASLRGLSVVDRDTVWVGGAKGTLWRTRDGGTSWQDVAPPDSAACDFRDVEAFDADTALAMVAGQPARLYRTSDGGKTWTIVLADARAAAFFDAMAFGGDVGILFGDPIDGAFCVWTSTDAGRTWNAVPAEHLPAPLAGEAAFAASGSCVAVDGTSADPTFLIATGGGERARLLYGRSGRWTAIEMPLAAGGSSRGGFGLAVGPEGTVLVGGDYADPTRSDGTAAFRVGGYPSWSSANGGAGGFRSAAVWIDRERVLAVGSHGLSLSGDGGRSWTVLREAGWHALGRGRDGSVFACGSDGRVARVVL